ncbi:uncharacterized protein GGS25DRAFT_519011 [Hypoxylon fragiforme]|uniref:uncharacterized protein n=1 Tax=Hypoxylon fragiforme TaxID=63214 RepID=UPI0020C5CD39|nr:uncharacterized protein GGS25DRAFT_519011 [Hypoxylon fragiforme]KAI2610714.1 hypothetical protein GGS25DRAFT_519011 [Hypoxylon fragiforme]
MADHPVSREPSTEVVTRSTTNIRRRVREFIEGARDHFSTMSGRYQISPADFDQLYQLYQEDTSAKGLYEFIVDHHITHDIAAKMNLRPIDVLARMVGKTAEACQKDLDEETALVQAAEKKAAEARAKVNADADAEPKPETSSDGGVRKFAAPSYW